MRTWHRARANAPSVPGLMGIHWAPPILAVTVAVYSARSNAECGSAALACVISPLVPTAASRL